MGELIPIFTAGARHARWRRMDDGHRAERNITRSSRSSSRPSQPSSFSSRPSTREPRRGSCTVARMKKKILLSVVALLLIGGIAYYALNRQPPAETRFSGAYRFDDGTLMMITPREGPILRFKK